MRYQSASRLVARFLQLAGMVPAVRADPFLICGRDLFP